MIPRGCVDQGFDAEFLGAPVWRLDDPDQAPVAVKEARGEGVGLVYHRGPADQGGWLTSIGFRHVETLVTFEGPRPTRAPPPMIRAAEPADADAVAEVARRAFTTDRWHADPLIPNAKADAFKAAWARNDVLGRADAVHVAEVNGAIAGFNAVLLRDGIAIIDLIAVEPGHQGGGLGTSLVLAMSGHAARRVRVGTQAANERSIALYQNLGFREMSRVETWHWVAT